MSVLDIAAWVFLAIGSLMVAWRLIALAIGPAWARRPRSGAHAMPAPLGDPAKRRKLWRELQAPLVVTVDAVIMLTPGSPEVIKLLIAVFMILLVPVWDITRWARSRASAKAGAATDPS